MPATNFSHPGCYARALRDCSDTLSVEHFVSESVLELLGDAHRISNASWLQPSKQSNPLPAQALGSRILCKRHNEMLSPLDDSARIFFGELLLALSDAPKPASNHRVSVDGDTLEKWVLKACCGAIASGNLVEGGLQLVRKPPVRWLEILFSEAPWPEGTGLHVRQAPMVPHRGYAIGATYLDGAWAGGGIEFAGVELFVLLGSDDVDRILEQTSGVMSSLTYRPGAIRIEARQRTTDIELRWHTWVPTRSILYRHT